MQNDMYLYFIAYANAFDKIRHKEPLELLGNHDIFEKEIRIIPKLYLQQTACIWIQ